jgi:prepilin-type N-terminal cleavage/methylation domain-containing protein
MVRLRKRNCTSSKQATMPKYETNCPVAGHFGERQLLANNETILASKLLSHYWIPGWTSLEEELGSIGRYMTQVKSKRARARPWSGMTLIEVLIALAIAGLGVGAIVSGYIFTVTSSERNALSLAANAKAMERIEEVRAAQWDTTVYPPYDQLSSTNFPDELVILDLSGTSSAVTYATNHVTISDISGPTPLRRIRVDCTWKFYNGSLMTNTIETCRAPDQ